MGRILREGEAYTPIRLTNSLGTTPAIEFAGWAGGSISFPNPYTSTSISIYASDSASGTFRRMEDGAGADLSMRATADRVVPLPDACYKAIYLKLVTNADDSGKDVILVRKG